MRPCQFSDKDVLKIKGDIDYLEDESKTLERPQAVRVIPNIKNVLKSARRKHIVLTIKGDATLAIEYRKEQEKENLKCVYVNQLPMADKNDFNDPKDFLSLMKEL